MEWTLRSVVFSALLPVVGIVAAADTVPLPSSDEHRSRVPQMEIGKVKRISKESLPPDLKSVAEDDIAKSRKGYEEVPEEYFAYLANYRNYLRQDSDVRPNLKMTLADITRTELVNYQYEGMIPGGPAMTSVTRVYQRSDGVLIKLTEWDFVADGGAIVIIDEVMNKRVSGVPAFLSIKQAPSGRAITTLEWATDKKQYSLTAEDDAKIRGTRKLQDQKWLVRLAESIRN